MRTATGTGRRCSYVITIGAGAWDSSALIPLAEYLSMLGVSGCDVIVIDSSAAVDYERNAAVLRWVSRHLSVAPGFDLMLTVAEQPTCEKVIIADEEIRYAAADLDRVCDLLDVHEVVEPQEFIEPLSWWGAIDAGRALVHRAVAPELGTASTFGFRRSALRPLRRVRSDAHEHPVCRLATFGVDVFTAVDLFVRRCPPAFGRWLGRRPASAEQELRVPARSMFFFALLPLICAVSLILGARSAAGFSAAVTFAAVVLAVRGRAGATRYFPWRTCAFAPLWIAEQSVSIYCALFRRLRPAAFDPAGASAAGSSGARAATN